MLDLSALDFSRNDGLITVVTQDATSGMVLMVGLADRESLERTLTTGEMHYFSRARGRSQRGSDSGHTQRVVSLACDCDGDVLLARVVPAGPSCHTGSGSCFIGPEATSEVLYAPEPRVAAAAISGTARSETWSNDDDLEDHNIRLAKLGEEAARLIGECADSDLPRATEEVANLLYHALVALRGAGGSLSDVQRVLAKRATPAMVRPVKAAEKGRRKT